MNVYSYDNNIIICFCAFVKRFKKITPPKIEVFGGVKKFPSFTNGKNYYFLFFFLGETSISSKSPLFLGLITSNSTMPMSEAPAMHRRIIEVRLS